ncbi:MAG TPA: type II/IV secretion system protein [Planctomycetes bacterium]|jgi:type IV pilus assembly protein PilB|nr:type II/IV secretion system protein [Planctomycetota bacterium]
MSGATQLIGEILIELGALSGGQLQVALGEQRRMGGRLCEILLAKEIISHEQLSQALARQQQLEWIPSTELNPSDEALEMLDASSARAFCALPLSVIQGQLRIAIGNPENIPLLGDVEQMSGCSVLPVLASETAIAEAVDKHYQQQVKAKRKAEEEVSSSAPIVRLLEGILSRAVSDKAADIHFEPYQGQFRIRMRSDGVLYEIDPPPAHLATALVSRIKVLADLDISETRMPQDGRIDLVIDGHRIDFRVSTVPTQGGESVVLRLLDQRNLQTDLTELGLDKSEEQQLTEFARRPHGIVLVTGPTGSGKTTTLYSLLHQVNDPDTKIITVEDPVEYDLDGIVQVPINEEINVTYQSVLRTMLRQDPDIILVGEIRDPETAQIAVEAALTGHLVLSTLHTNDAPSTVTRMIDLGVEPFLLAATIEGIVAQRLVRCVCPECSQEVKPTAQQCDDLGISADETFFKGQGCANCHFTGYTGRTAIYEILELDSALKEQFLGNPSTILLREQARKRNMRTLRERAIELARAGRTTLEEVIKGTQAQDS